MDVFGLRQNVIGQYGSYISSFINIREERVHHHVKAELDEGLLWPDPLLQLNPSFAPGGTIADLVGAGLLHPLCTRIFSRKEPGKMPVPLTLHQHQRRAVEAAAAGDSYVLTTGTGSGKSLSYIIPIVDFVLRHGSGQGIRAIVVYPMNALANSQLGELEKFLATGFEGETAPVTFRRYTGQDQEIERAEILTRPPDILLTNYMMLELLLTRPREHRIVEAAQKSLRFLVLDELHTYRGRQGADVAMLVRRVRDLCSDQSIQCVGTSATLAEGGSFAQQQTKVAKVASTIFGTPVKAERIIGETLRRVTSEPADLDNDFAAALRERVIHFERYSPVDFATLRSDPLATWIETTFGLATEAETGRLKRAQPIGIRGKEGAAAKLAAQTRLPQEICQAAIEQTLLAGYRIAHPESGFPIFAFRLHQFISRGDAVYASLEPAPVRHITIHGQQFVPGDRSRILLPLAFCRECGQEYYLVRRTISQPVHYLARDLRDLERQDGAEAGFLYRNEDEPWPDEREGEIERLPEDWLEIAGDGLQVKKSARDRLPKQVSIDAGGQEHAGATSYHFVRSPFTFCLRCGVTYAGRQGSDYGKLASLSSEGRSTATTVLSVATIQALRKSPALEFRARKLLSFTDNRQDASLQAGHLNDFIEVGLLRMALQRAVAQAGPEGITHETLAHKVFATLALPLSLYAVDPTVKYAAKADTDRALREVLTYRIYHDLRRGWRVTAPNLEQCDLLRIEYRSLDELCAAEEEWHKAHPALADASPSSRFALAKVLLDYLRRELVIKVDALDSQHHESLRYQSNQKLKEPWAIDEKEKLVRSFTAFPRGKRPGDTGEFVYVSGRGGFGMHLRRPGTLPHYKKRLSPDESEGIIRQLFAILRVAGLLEPVIEINQDPGNVGYQIPAAAFLWRAGDGSEPLRDVIRVPRASSNGARVNPFFHRLYRQPSLEYQSIYAREHTAQVPADQRIQREQDFREATLPLLYCSPTMELGVDIAQLNAVNMRNVPPTPANYAQRSGRAGRSGQPALVFTYCSTGSPHDQYFFKHPEQMVAGAVAAPRLDIANEDLVRAHVHAVWLRETGQDLYYSLKDLLDVSGQAPTLALLPTVSAALADRGAKRRAKARVNAMLGPLQDELTAAGWYRDGWTEAVLDQAESAFDKACDRWRDLYRAALAQRDIQHKIIGDATRSQKDKSVAHQLRTEAEAQMRLLLSDERQSQSDFYTYRYFASEGFLPGYSFPRLPLSAYLPGRRENKLGRDEYLSRPRFLAISEFGPRSIIYHEGARYIVNKVILPAELHSAEGLITSSAKLCPACGHLHPIVTGVANPDRCERCGALLATALHALMRMQNVSAQRRDRITSDEEERTRMGYEVVTGVRLEGAGAQSTTRVALVTGSGGAPLLELTYGHAATIWRINKGWRRRKPESPLGFVLDVERGYWEKGENEDDEESDEQEAATGPRKQRVIPYVADRRNCLLIKPAAELPVEVMASLQPALKNAIQVLYQIEDNELAAEPLPDAENRRQILFYEAAEGGAGVLRQLLDDPQALVQVARTALRICHFDPVTGEDLLHAERSRENCEAACYTNQTDHRLLDRQTIWAFLRELAQAAVAASPTAQPRTAHLADLQAQADSSLEQAWLAFAERHRLRLPDKAQVHIPTADCSADFLYENDYVVIFVDGPVHDQAHIAARDRQIERALADLGYTALRFRWDEQALWPALAAQQSWLFGQIDDGSQHS
jgi:ATP-dependent helicase YprA (DUF1998 family)